MKLFFDIVKKSGLSMFGLNRQLETYMKNKTPMTVGFKGNFFQNLYIVDYDKNFITLSDEKNDNGIIVTYNMKFVESFSETLDEPTEE